MSETTEKAKPSKVQTLVKKLHQEVVGDSDKGKLEALKQKLEKVQGEKRVLQDKLRNASSGTTVRSEIVTIAVSVTKAKNDGKALSDLQKLKRFATKLATSETALDRPDVEKMFRISAEVLSTMPKPQKVKEEKKEQAAEIA